MLYRRFSFVHGFSVTQSCPTLCDPMVYNMPDIPVLHHLPKFAQTHIIESVMPSSYLDLYCSLLLLPSIFPNIRVFEMNQFFPLGGQTIGASALASVLPINIQGLISFRMDWLDLLAVQGTLKSLLQHYSSKESILWHPAFFIVQFSHPYISTGKTIALTRQTFVRKVMSLLFNTLSMFVICFLPRSKHLLI